MVFFKRIFSEKQKGGKSDKRMFVVILYETEPPTPELKERILDAMSAKYGLPVETSYVHGEFEAERSNPALYKARADVEVAMAIANAKFATKGKPKVSFTQLEGMTVFGIVVNVWS